MKNRSVLSTLIVTILLSITYTFSMAQSWPAGIHDPSSITKCDDKYWIFGTGEGIHTKYSTDMVTWTDGETPFSTSDFPSWILKYAKTSTDQFAGYFWAPDIIFMNNKYYLYYSCSVWGTMSSCIGVVVNKTLDPQNPEYKWEDQGDIGIYSSGGSVNAIDPAIMRGKDGKIWMTYGSFNRDGIMVTELDSVSGKPISNLRTSVANSWTGGSAYGEGEGGCMVYHDDYYYLFYNKGGCCAGIASTYYVVMGRSRSPKGPFLDKTKKKMRIVGAKSGGTIVFKHDANRGLEDRYYGPGHIGVYKEDGIDYISFHYYSPNGYYPNADANYKGGPTLGLAKLEWGDDGWPKISMDFVDKGYYTLKNVNSSKVLDTQSHKETSGSNIYQYSLSTYDTQKWLFTPLGTGEYTIRSYADSTLYIEASGTNNEELLRITDDYQGSINQKFRVVKSPDQKVIIYPSDKDQIFEIPNANKFISQVKLWVNTNSTCQRWITTPFIETLSVNDSSLLFNYADSVASGITLTSNGTWEIISGDESWLSVTPTSGSGTKMLTINTTENLGQARTSKLTIRSKAGNLLDVIINQNGFLTHTIDATKTTINVYPNPTEKILFIKSTTSNVISLYNSLGVRVMSKRISSGESKVDIEDLASGVYILKISGGAGTAIKRIYKK